MKRRVFLLFAAIPLLLTGCAPMGRITGGDARTGGKAMKAPTEEAQSAPTLAIEANGHTFYAVLEDNSSAEALVERLSEGPVALDLHDYGGFEKVGGLPWTLPRNDASITTAPGDVILYQGDQITIYYDENTWSFTRLAKIQGATKESLLDAFGDGNVTVTFRIE